MPDLDPIQWIQTPDRIFYLARHLRSHAVIEPSLNPDKCRYEGRVYNGRDLLVTQGDDVDEIKRRCEQSMRADPDPEVEHARVVILAIRGRIKGLVDVGTVDGETSRKLTEIVNLINQSGLI